MTDPLVYPTRKAALIPLNLCLGANFNGLYPKMVEYQENEYVLVKYNMDLCQRLSKIGVRLPGPIRFHYKWPAPWEPFRHQKVTADFLTQNLRAFCFNEIGTGKSASAIWAADFLMNLGVIHKVLVASTLSTLDIVWDKELFQLVPHRNVQVVHGERDLRHRRLNDRDADFYITNHESLKDLVPLLYDRSDIDMILVDEGAKFRNSKTKTLWTPCHSIINEQVPRACWWMTGSPMPKEPTDLWGQARIVNPGTVPRYFSRFRDMTMRKVTQYKWVPVRGWEDIAYSAVQPSIRFKRKDCIDMPPTFVPPPEVVPMSAQQNKAYKDFKEHFLAEIEGQLLTAVNEGAQRIKLLQIASGAIYHPDRSYTILDCKPKLSALSAHIEETNYKLIVYVAYTHGLDVIGKFLTAKYPELKYETLWGQASRGRRRDVLRDFQDGDLNVILAHPEVMAHGVTLTATNTICWWGAIDDYEIYEQANGRISRISQDREQYIIRLSCSPIETEVYRRLERKESMQGLLLDMIDN